MLQQQIISLAQTIAGDMNAVEVHIGDLTALPTTNKSNLVDAIAELYAMPAPDGGVQIDDDAVAGNTTVTYSVNKIIAVLEEYKRDTKNELVDGAGAALDTLKELATALGDNPNFAAEIATALAKRVRVDAPQVFTTIEKKQACDNLGIGDPDTDFVAAYNLIRGA